VKLLTVGKSSDYKDYLLNHMNQTSYAVLFCADLWAETIELQSFDREALYNESLERKEPSKVEFFLPC